MSNYLHKPYRSKYVSIYNFIVPLLKIFGKDAKSDLSFEALHKIAEKETGLSDFGSDDYHQALNVLIDDVLKHQYFHSFGYMVAKGMILDSLKNRLYLEAAYAKSPEIENEDVRGAIWILGLPRTGSTLLHHLLSLDEGNRTLKRWEASCPSPIHEDPDIDRKQRMEKAKVSDKVLHTLAPDLLKKHAMGWDLPEECVVLFRDTFKSQLFGFSLGLDEYSQWLRDQELTPEYRYYLRQLKVLQTQERKDRWVFKAPFHSLHVKAIESAFDAPRYINLHRNPTSVLPSVASLGETLQGMSVKYVDRRMVGENVLKECKMAIDNVENCRKDISDDRVIDIYFADFIRDPAGTIETIYAKWDIPFTNDFKEKIHEFMKNNPKNKHGEHKYACDEYGLTDGNIAKNFGNYMASFS